MLPYQVDGLNILNMLPIFKSLGHAQKRKIGLRLVENVAPVSDRTLCTDQILNFFLGVVETSADFTS